MSADGHCDREALNAKVATIEAQLAESRRQVQSMAGTEAPYLEAAWADARLAKAGEAEAVAGQAVLVEALERAAEDLDGSGAYGEADKIRAAIANTSDDARALLAEREVAQLQAETDRRRIVELRMALWQFSLNSNWLGCKPYRWFGEQERPADISDRALGLDAMTDDDIMAESQRARDWANQQAPYRGHS